MATAYTSLLGLALPVTGELSGTWGNTVNTEITSLLDSAIAGTTTISADADITLTTTTGAANESREAIILWTAGGTTTRNITAPAQSKAYIVINKSSSTQSIVLRGAGPTTGVTIIKGESAVCAWNGTDFIKVSNTSGAGTFTDLTVTGVASFADGTVALPSITNTGDTNTGIFFPAADTIAFTEGGAESMRIDSSGNVGIGTSSPNYRLNVGDTSSVTTLNGVGLTLFSNVTLTSNIGGVLNFRPGLGTTISDIFNLSICAYDHSGDTNADGLSINGSDGISFCTGGNSRNERMRIDSSGNVMIGATTSNSVKFVVDSGASSFPTAFIKTSGAIPDNNDNSALYVLHAGTAGTGLRVRTDQALTGSNFAHIFVNNASASINGLQVSQYGTGWIASFDKSGTVAMRIDNSGNVGIGNTAANVNDQVGAVRPLLVSKADAVTTIAGSQAAIVIGNSDTTTSNTSQLSFAAITGASTTFFTSAAINCIFGARTNGQYPTGILTFSTSTTLNAAPTEKMRIDNSGNVGIGTTSPNAKLEIKAASASQRQLQLTHFNSTDGWYFTADDTGGVLKISRQGSSSLNGEAMRIDSSGKVLVGTTSSDAKFAVVASGATFPLIRAQSDSPSSFGVYGQYNAKYGGTDRDWFFGQASDGSFGIWDYTPGVTNRLTITTGGIVGIATSSPNASFQATVAGTGFTTTRVNFGGVAGFSDGSSIICGSDGVNPTSWVNNANFKFGSNRDGCVVAINPTGYTYEGGSGGGSRTFAVSSNGNVQNSNNSYGSLSDAKLKENIADATPKLESLMRVKIRNFNLIADEAKTKQIGVVAQELEEIFPSMIEEHIDYTFESYVREDGVTDSRGIPTGTVTKEVKYSVFVPMLVKAIQELKAEFDAYKSTHP